jgi:hypothetical protein
MAQLSTEALPLLSTYPSTNYYGLHVTKADYDRALIKRVYRLLRARNTVLLLLLGSTMLRSLLCVNQYSD